MDVTSVAILLEKNWTNPFEPKKGDLVTLSMGARDSSEIASDM